ncbi:hypothetical protein M1116_01290 [Patescibacteria group bacterium]|nr:hypothetical protein [Patescibacteria group bacterium]
MTAISPAAAYLAARAVLDILWYGQWQYNVGAVFVLTALIEIGILGYLGYWTLEVIRKNHKDQFREE